MIYFSSISPWRWSSRRVRPGRGPSIDFKTGGSTWFLRKTLPQNTLRPARTWSRALERSTTRAPSRVYRAEGASDRTTLLFPGLVGGHNWGGGAFDPNSGYVFVFSQDLGSLGWMEDAPEGSLLPYQRGRPRPSNFNVQIGDARLPCQKPPWGRLTAVDASSGDVVWQQSIGITEQLPADRQNTGRPGRAAAIVTGGGVLFVASTDDNRLRALEATTGRELWVSRMDRTGNANPMTYLGADGRQYVVVVATDAVLAYQLP